MTFKREIVRQIRTIQWYNQVRADFILENWAEDIDEAQDLQADFLKKVEDKMLGILT